MFAFSFTLPANYDRDDSQVCPGSNEHHHVPSTPAARNADLIKWANYLSIGRRMLDAINEQYADLPELVPVQTLAQSLAVQASWLGEQLTRTPASSIYGLRAKAAALMRCSEGAETISSSSSLHEALRLSIARDRLNGVGNYRTNSGVIGFSSNLRLG